MLAISDVAGGVECNSCLLKIEGPSRSTMGRPVPNPEDFLALMGERVPRCLTPRERVILSLKCDR
jgi:hypothetical protein